ncbi:MAG: hypothetical protein Kow009_14840 [Spirochaetales bacterium]
MVFHVDIGHFLTYIYSMVSPLSAIDAAVKAHEWSHLHTLGPYAAGPIQYDFVMDSEGNRYAVGGSVAVDLSPVPGDPEATARKAKAILQAAYAPGNPSGADLQVAQKAYLLLRDAEEELQSQEEVKSQARAEAIGSQADESRSLPARSVAQAREIQAEESGPLPARPDTPAKGLEAKSLESGGSEEETATRVASPLKGPEIGTADRASPGGQNTITPGQEKPEQPAWMFLYTPGGEQSSWYNFWFEREDSLNRGVLVSLWA